MTEDTYTDLQDKTRELKDVYEKLSILAKSKTHFVSTVSHELRGPLTSIIGFGITTINYYEKYIVPELSKTDEKLQNNSCIIKENLGIVVSEGERLLHLIKDMLSVANRETEHVELNIQAVDIIAVCERARSAMSGYLKCNSVQVLLEAPGDVKPVKCNAEDIVKVVSNFLSNAYRFTEQGSVTIKIVPEEKHVKVAVIDTGKGIEKEYLAKIFNKVEYFDKNSTENIHVTCLGLPVCKELVEQFGGTMCGESEVGKGSNFSFTLDYFTDNEEDEKQSGPIKKLTIKDIKQRAGENKKVRGRPNILVVDDDPYILRLLYQELEDYNVTLADNGKEAIELVSNSENSYDLVITDLMMKGLDGIRILKSVKNISKDIMVMILTGYGDMKSAIDALRLDADDYLEKPFNTERFHFSIRRCFEKLEFKRKIKLYENILPVCCVCKKIRDDSGKEPGSGNWSKMETYIWDKTKVAVSHSYCPDCYKDAIK